MRVYLGSDHAGFKLKGAPRRLAMIADFEKSGELPPLPGKPGLA